MDPVLLLSSVSYKDLIDQSIKQQGNVSNLPGAFFVVRMKYYKTTAIWRKEHLLLCLGLDSDRKGRGDKHLPVLTAMLVRTWSKLSLSAACQKRDTHLGNLWRVPSAALSAR